MRIRDEVLCVNDTVKLVATIRDDLEWRIDREVPELRPLLERRVIVTAVDANCARSIIEEPARALGYDVEGIDEVSREVEERLASDPAKLPVLQYALSEWWERRDEARKVLPAAAWKGLALGHLRSGARLFHSPPTSYPTRVSHADPLHHRGCTVRRASQRR